MKNYRIICRNQRCGYDGVRRYSNEEFDKLQYPSGISCSKCGFPRATIVKSQAKLCDSFKPGFQRNIMKYCANYSEYKAHLKNMGLVEMGYEDFKDEDIKEEYKVWDDDLIKYMVDRGLEISDREAVALKENKLIEEDKVISTPDEVLTDTDHFKKASEKHERETLEQIKAG